VYIRARRVDDDFREFEGDKIQVGVSVDEVALWSDARAADLTEEARILLGITEEGFVNVIRGHAKHLLPGIDKAHRAIVARRRAGVASDLGRVEVLVPPERGRQDLRKLLDDWDVPVPDEAIEGATLLGVQGGSGARLKR
jgi:hypothetical protein